MTARIRAGTGHRVNGCQSRGLLREPRRRRRRLGRGLRAGRCRRRRRRSRAPARTAAARDRAGEARQRQPADIRTVVQHRHEQDRLAVRRLRAGYVVPPSVANAASSGIARSGPLDDRAAWNGSNGSTAPRQQRDSEQGEQRARSLAAPSLGSGAPSRRRRRQRRASPAAATMAHGVLDRCAPARRGVALSSAPRAAARSI